MLPFIILLLSVKLNRWDDPARRTGKWLPTLLALIENPAWLNRGMNQVRIGTSQNLR